jgi:hypothetical protein
VIVTLALACKEYKDNAQNKAKKGPGVKEAGNSQDEQKTKTTP